MTQETLTIITPEFTDARGTIANILRDTDLSHVAIITSKKGSVRGNHWHPKDEQWMYLVSGSYMAYAYQMGYEGEEDAAGVLRTTVQRVEAGMLAYCPPGIAHAYYFTSDSIFLNLGRDPRRSENFAEHTKTFDIVDGHGRPLL